MKNEYITPLETEYLIGIDGGGTKTEFVIFSNDGVIVDRILLGGCNPNSGGFNNTLDTISKGINILKEKYTNIKGVFVGASGLASGKFATQLKEWFKNNYPGILFDCKTDICNVIASSSFDEDCIAVIAGTGLVVNLYSKGMLRKVAGWGHLFEVAGSGFNIGADAFRAALGDVEGFEKKTIITSMIEERLGEGIWNAIPRIYNSNHSFIASFAPIVFDAFELGDEVAKEIINNNAKRVAFLINKLKENSNLIKTVVVSGSLFTTNDIYLEFVKSNIDSDVNFITPDVPQVYGACVMCCKMCGMDCKELITSFKTRYIDFVNKGDD